MKFVNDFKYPVHMLQGVAPLSESYCKNISNEKSQSLNLTFASVLSNINP